MIRKMLNSSLAAIRLALKIDESPVMKLPEKAHAVSMVAATAGTTMFLRIAIVARMTTMPARYIQWAAVSSTSIPGTFR